MQVREEVEGLATDIVQGPIRYRPHDHTYTHEPTRTKLTSVSAVINCVYNTKSWDGADPSIVENARIRGVAVDRYLTTYVREQCVQIVGESSDVQERVIAAHRIWEDRFHGLPAETQKIVFSLEDGIAGTMDFFVDERIVVDLKCTYNLEKSYALQIGAYCDYMNAELAGIIHISPKVYPKTGGVWIEYDVPACREYWRKAVGWWKETKTFAKAISKK